MKTLSQTEPRLSRVLASWVTYHVARTLTAIRPAYRAGEIAAHIAANGNPSGA
jgi:hypothetical protein